MNPYQIYWREIMAFSKVEELPQDIKEQLPEHAQQIFFAAFNAAQSDGLSEDGAREIAWNSVRHKYAQSKDGQWYRKPEDTAQHNKAITTGGN
jgi:cation transport regulator